VFDRLRARGFDLLVRNHAEAILSVDFPAETAELVEALSDYALPAAEIIGSGGGEAPATQRLRRRLSEAGWLKHTFLIETKIDGVTKDSTTHEIDHVRRTDRGRLALEIEWNNKDPFFDRDLENFQRLHAQSVISVGVVVTRGAGLQAALPEIVAGFIRARGIDQEAGLLPFGMKDRTVRQRAAVTEAMARGADFADAFTRQFVADKYGQATTHWRKLEERVARGVGNPCPLLLIGLPAGIVAR
jgi:hypothetical protein